MICRYSAEDSKYTYSVGICTTAILKPPPKQANAGALQTHKTSEKDEVALTTHVMGSYEQAEVMMGSKYSYLHSLVIC